MSLQGVFAVVLMGLGLGPALAEDIPGGAHYELIGRWEPDRLNHILDVEMPAFSGVTVNYTPARNAVKLYRVTYPSVVPEQGNRPITATGLVAVPEVEGKTLPVVSWQHGTVYGKEQVPSFPEQSEETEAMIAQFAGQGYVVIGADYFGMGSTTEPEGYIVKGSQQQACFDMLTAGRGVMTTLGLEAGDVFLAGWSQGGYVTMAFLEQLEAAGMAPKAAATASAPIDPYVGMTGFLNFPRPNAASWLNSMFILSAFSYENYYNVPGLARSVINDEYYEMSRKAYEREPGDPTQIPTDLHKLVRAEYFDPQFFAASTFGRLLAANDVYRWVIQTPVRNYYGESDEAISLGLGRLAMTYQQAIGNDKVEAVSTGPTTHRGTFATAIPEWKSWFDSLQGK